MGPGGGGADIMEMEMEEAAEELRWCLMLFSRVRDAADLLNGQQIQ
jgi:hypothetical protein